MIMQRIKNMLDECMLSIVNDTDIEDLLIATFENKDEEFLTNAISFIIESLILERTCVYEKKVLLAEYGRIGQMLNSKAKSKETTCERQEIKDSFLEESSSKGLQNFLDAFDDEFEYKDAILSKIRKLFKNYKFKKINIINDYTMLFFTFALYDETCNIYDESRVDELNDIADMLAQNCFNELHNPYNKKAVTVSSESLLRFVKKSVDGDYLEWYIKIMIKFVKAVKNSDMLPDYIIYEIFARFYRHIEVINNCMVGASQSQRGGKYFFKGIKVISKKVYKYIYNTIQRLKRNGCPEEIEILIKELQKNISWFEKSMSKVDQKSEETRYKKSIVVVEAIFELMDLLDENTEDSLLNDILQQYSSLSVEFKGKTYGVLEFIIAKYFESILYYNRNLSKKEGKEKNPFIVLLFSAQKQNLDEIMGIYEWRKRCDIVMSDVREIVESKLPIISSEEYRRLIKYVDFDKFDIPILNSNIEDHCYKSAMKNIKISLS